MSKKIVEYLNNVSDDYDDFLISGISKLIQEEEERRERIRQEEEEKKRKEEKERLFQYQESVKRYFDNRKRVDLEAIDKEIKSAGIKYTIKSVPTQWGGYREETTYHFGNDNVELRNRYYDISHREYDFDSVKVEYDKYTESSREVNV